MIARTSLTALLVCAIAAPLAFAAESPAYTTILDPSGAVIVVDETGGGAYRGYRRGNTGGILDTLNIIQEGAETIQALSGAVVATEEAGDSATRMERKGYCYVATVSYGTLSDEVRLLATFRDEKLIGGGVGRQMVSHYYRYSPPVAAFIAGKPAVQSLARLALEPFVGLAGAAK